MARFELTPLDHLADCGQDVHWFVKYCQKEWGGWGIFVEILEIRVVCGMCDMHG